MTFKTKISLAIATTMVVIVGLVLMLIQAQDRKNSFNWKVGYKYVYALEYKGVNDSHLVARGQNDSGSSKQMLTKMDYALDMVFIPVAYRRNQFFIRTSFENIHRLEFTMNGQEAIADKNALNELYLNRSAVVVMNESGEISQVKFRENESLAFKSSLKLFLGELQIRFAEDDREWEQDEISQYGKYRATYRFVEQENESTRYRKTKGEYAAVTAITRDMEQLSQQVDAHCDIAFSAEGHIQEIQGREKTRIVDGNGKPIFGQDSDITFQLTGFKKMGSDLAKLQDLNDYADSTVMGEIDTNEEMMRRYWIERSQNITMKEMAATLEHYSEKGELYARNLFWWRATAYLKAFPERCRDLVGVFEKEHTSNKARIFIFGILSSVGHEKAQETMREIIKGEPAVQDEMYPIYVQNFSLVNEPTDATLMMIQQMYKESRYAEGLKASAPLAYGAMAGNLYKHGHVEKARSINQEIVTDLNGTTNDSDREDLLNALGNVAMEENIQVAKDYMEAGHERVRAAAINAVRYTQTTESEHMLLDMFADRSEIVQRNAISTLGIYQLNKDHLQNIREKIENDMVQHTTYTDIVQVLMSNPEEKETVADILSLLKSKGVKNPQLETRINTILRDLAS